MIDRSSRRRFGQNYLRDKSVIYQIVDKINPGKEDSFIEIGPGQGAITAGIKNNSKNLTLIEIDKEISLENEVNTEADTKVEEFNKQINELETKIKNELERVEPIRQKNIENLSKIQRLNLELKALDEESARINEEIDAIKNVLVSLDPCLLKFA